MDFFIYDEVEDPVVLIPLGGTVPPNTPIGAIIVEKVS